MSPDFERLIGRAVTDKAFRDKVLADPDGAVKDAGFSLTDEELDQLKAAVAKTDSQQLDQQVGVLGWN